MPMYRNPVIPGFYPDPSVCRVGSDYYLVTSTFEYFPGVPIFHSRDLVNWRQIGHCLTRPEQLALQGVPSSCGIFAPTLRHHEGVFYMTTTNVTAGGNFIVTAKKPEGPWSDPVFVDQPGIDPSLFFDVDGSVLYTTSSGGALQSRIDVHTGKHLTEPKVVWTGTGGQYPEGPHLYLKDGAYMLLMSEGGTEYGHMITMARSRSPWGPFEACARNPVFTHRSYRSPIQAVGHADLVQTASGEWFAVFLGIRPNGYPPCYHLGRETFLTPVQWAEDGFPVFGDAGHTGLDVEASFPDGGSPAGATPVTVHDDFMSEKLDLDWNHLRNPTPELWSLREREGYLRLRGSADGLDDVAAPAWIGRRQCHFAVQVATCVEFAPSTECEEAGLVVRMNERHHYEVFVTLRKGKPSVVLRRRIGSLQVEEACHSLSESQAVRLVLCVDANRDRYVFSYGASKDELQPLGEGETRYLSTEVAGGFTGVYFAMYSSGNGSPCQEPADFDWFDYDVRDD